MGCLYKLTSPSRKSYIGVTKKTAALRWEKHKEHAIGKRDSGALYSALRKYGPDSFTLQVLIVCNDWDKLLALEKQFIRIHNTLTPNGYNISEGGQGASWVVTDKFRANVSAAQKKRFQNPEERAKNAEHLRSFRKDPEAVKRWRASHWSAMRRNEVRAKLREAATNQFSNPEARGRVRFQYQKLKTRNTESGYPNPIKPA